ncbi:hypothetical protein [Paraburkholderia mimosarum]|uniref:hypothetical protein n=1 Tax=Paraburkholderia mimosarum TaxID=312026 RepID=UPI0012B52181|nr:hypothetical protein [Paraburkholderia mimosarum]
MAKANFTAAAEASNASARTEQSTPSADRELQIRIDIERYTEYKGTRAQLEAEGIIPPDLEWPEGGRDTEWTSGQTEYVLCRCRPDGLRGPNSVWLRGNYDCWMLRIFPGGCADVINSQIRLKLREVHRALYFRSAEGQACSTRTWQAAAKAHTDERFQAFKALIPGLVPPPRKPRGASKFSGAGHD